MTVYGYCKSDPDIPIGELDYGFIEKCDDIGKLQKILEILRSGEEGKYPDLEQFTENQLAKKNPDHPLLEKYNREKRLQDMSKDEIQKTIDELKDITSIPYVKSSVINGNSDTHLPPIRNSNGTEYVKNKDPEVVATETGKTKKNPVPRGPEYWDKLNKQLDTEDAEGNYENICKEKTTYVNTHVNSDNDVSTKPAHELLSKQKSKTDDVLHEDATAAANNEKNKGNEAFRCGDYKEALIYYDRSLDISPIPASFNNKAITLIKLEKFKEALGACDMVIGSEPDNIKAHMRRGIANQSLENLEEARRDFAKVAELEPSNKRGKELLLKVTSELEKKNANQKKKGHRMKIEEVTTAATPQSNGEHNSEIIDNNKERDTSPKENAGVPPPVDLGTVDVETQGKSLDSMFQDSKLSSILEFTKQFIQKSENEGDTMEIEKLRREIQEIEKITKDGTGSLEEKNEKMNSIMNENNKEIGKNELGACRESDINVKSSVAQNFIKEFSQSDINVKSSVSQNVIKELPVKVVTLKDKGNVFYKAGQYDKACEKYTSCINELLKNKDGGYEQSLATFYSNRASCQTRMGLSKQCIADCDLAINLSRSAKAYLKRADAYESLEKYINAYVDYQNAHKMDSSLVKALQACSRVGNVLRNRYGSTWRDMLPKTDVVIPSNSVGENVDAKEQASVEKEKENVEKDIKRVGNEKERITEEKAAVKTPSKIWEDLNNQSLNVCNSDKVKNGNKVENGNKIENGNKVENGNKIKTGNKEDISEKVTQPTKNGEQVHKEVENTDKTSEKVTAPLYISPPSKNNEQVQKEPEVDRTPNGVHNNNNNNNNTSAKEKQPSNNNNINNNNNNTKAKKENVKRGTGDAKVGKEQLDRRQDKEHKILNFYDMKEKGNNCVQKGKYEEAIEFYTHCVQLMPNEIPSYTNRALCYLKLKEAEKAIADCSHALKLQPSHVKALFRRAQARKMLKAYKECLADLTQVLKLEPNNNAAKKEMEQCKSEFRDALRSIQAENEAVKLRDAKSKGKKVLIEEITSESAEFAGKGKMSTKIGKCPLAKENGSKGGPQSKKMTGYEFLHAWNNVKSKKTADYAELLLQIDATKLVDMLSNKLDGEILKNFIHTINEYFTTKDMFRRGVLLLKSLCKASRFVTMLMFLNTPEKALLRATVDSLEMRARQTSEKTLISDINNLRVAYQCS